MSQAVAEQTFRELSTEVVKRFLQTVVVLDDGATMEQAPSVGEVVEPDPSAPILAEDAEVPAEAPAAYGGSRNPLDANALISGFAEHGLVCAVLAPSSGTDVSDPTIRTSRRADIVILDWELGDEGEKTLEITRRLIEQDQDAGGRLRMIAVYTATTNLEDVQTKVSDELPHVSPVLDKRPDNILVSAAQHTRILFIRKGKTSSLAGQVSETDLPGRIIAEFVEMGKGILANVAFAGIAAIREETHQVFARLHSELDAPFLTHRVLLENPRDAEGYAVDLLSSEIVALLRHKGIGSKYAGREAIRLAVTERESRGTQFQLMTKKDSQENPRDLTVDELMELVDSGPSGLTEITNVGVKTRQLHERLYLLFARTLEKGKEWHYEFARISARSRDPQTVESDYRATLDFGSVVTSKGSYFVCIQPSCDALRLSKETQFIFAACSEGQESFDVVVKNPEGNDVCLKLNPKACEIRTVSFAPSEGSGTVLTSMDDKRVRKFTSTSKEEFTWICDLRIVFAQRFVHRIASDLSRIGLDEFEWQRRLSL